jgi:hypothetical protein
VLRLGSRQNIEHFSGALISAGFRCKLMCLPLKLNVGKVQLFAKSCGNQQ